MIPASLFAKYAADPAAFRASLTVEADGVSRRFGDIQDPFQAVDFAACDPGWQRCIGRQVDHARSRIYLERPRGHSKTSDLAMMVAWALCFAPRVISGFAAAADKDQSALLRSAVLRLIRQNPWLGEILETQNYVVKNIAANHPGKDSSLEIISADAGSSYGLLPDFIVADELTHWGGDGELWQSLFSSAAKRSTCMLVVISNAGRSQGDCWQWSVREAARTSPLWHFNSLDGPQASWISPEILEEQRLVLPGAAWKRLWLNRWTHGGDALDGADVRACITQTGPMNGDERGYRFVGGLDLSTRKDHSSLVLLGANGETQRVRLAAVKSWAPGPGGQVDLEAVLEAVIQAHQRYRPVKVFFDPFQCALLSQQARRVGVRMEEMPFTGANCNRMASAILDTFRSRRIDLYDDPALIRDLGRLCIEERQWGFKLTASRDKSGHADRAISLAIALPGSLELVGKRHRPLVVG